MMNNLLILPNSRYRFVKEYSISHIDFLKSKRLYLYSVKGNKCVKCNTEFPRLIQGRDNGGNLHWDLYNENLTSMLTNGHIIPKSKGGGDSYSNLRPLCYSCNQIEGDTLDHLLNEKDFPVYLEGKLVMRKSGHPFQSGEKLAKINGYFFNKIREENYFAFDSDKKKFTYPANKVIFPKIKV